MSNLTIFDRVRHFINPLHVYCSLTHLVSRTSARWTAEVYERWFFAPVDHR